MTLRHAERLSADGDIHDQDSASSDDGHSSDDILAALLPGAGAPVPQARRKPSANSKLVVHPAWSDYGPESLQRFIRDQFAQAKPVVRTDAVSRDTAKAKGKGKGKARDAGRVDSNLTSSQSNRRSVRLAEKTGHHNAEDGPGGAFDTPQSNAAASTPSRRHWFSAITAAAGALPFVTSSQPDADTGIASSSTPSKPMRNSSRLSDFQDFSKSKRMIVRDIVTNSARGSDTGSEDDHELPAEGASHGAFAVGTTPPTRTAKLPRKSVLSRDNLAMVNVLVAGLTEDFSNFRASMPDNASDHMLWESENWLDAQSAPESASTPVSIEIRDHDHPLWPTRFDYRQLLPEDLPDSLIKEFFAKARGSELSQRKEQATREGPPPPELDATTALPASRRALLHRDYPDLRRSRHQSLLFGRAPPVDPRAGDQAIPETDRVVVGSYPRAFRASLPDFHRHIHPSAQSVLNLATSNSISGPSLPSLTIVDFNHDVWACIGEYLSTQDIHNLRLANSQLAAKLGGPLLFKSVVVKFGRRFFDINNGSWASRTGSPPDNSMLKKYGSYIDKFGISFECDLLGLSCAGQKKIEEQVSTWYGQYTWPTKEYPRYTSLEEMEDLVDNNRSLLKDSLRHLENPRELGLSVDSGHGWLEGPDTSDLALLDKIANPTTVFGKRFKHPNSWTEFATAEYFKWAQQNTLNETKKHIIGHRKITQSCAVREMRFLENMEVREYQAFEKCSEQHDFDVNSHVGGIPSTPPPGAPPAQAAAAVPAPQPQNPLLPNHHHPIFNGNFNVQGHFHVFQPLPQPQILQPGQGPPWNVVGLGAPQGQQLAPPIPMPVAPNHQAAIVPRRSAPRRHPWSKKQPQWPLIFSGYNIAGEVGGHCPHVQDKVAHPMASPFLPGSLTHAQAQWLMETVWAQRAFLSSYTTAVITNAVQFTCVTRLVISRLSSGLLPSLAQDEFWRSLPNLSVLEIKVSPDWRQEHTTGDKNFSRNMLIPPQEAANKFMAFLKAHIIKLEGLHELTIGFVGGGENAVGMFARNQHVLPAPIIDNPEPWLFTTTRPTPPLRFDHVKTLKLVNCWFTPRMLEDFMHQSRDTSLKTLILDSISLTGRHDASISEPLTVSGSDLRCVHEPAQWLHETLPMSTASWTRVLDAITPGATILDKKYEANMIDEALKPRPTRSFRGYINEIVLESCGYVKISLPKTCTFNQNPVVAHYHSPLDAGLKERKSRFGKFPYGKDVALRELNLPIAMSNADGSRAMLSASDVNGAAYPWLGTLTQCVHPIEKRVLEQMWGLVFGWGDDMKRWASVEDGCFEGGTGRFSGRISREANEE